ncbi:hypothetical protein [Herbaspirillum sp. B65]|uniref:hypothetical protein n=1 Tax=Herbaspirillum sp. B65 TaxID=137708 RepID=UPI0011D236C1|nr:hypothetical protein [Herbaspirillum sp. B65]
MAMEDLFAQISSSAVVVGDGLHTKVRYHLNGRDIFHVELEGHLAKRYSGLSMIEKDLAKAMRWAVRATEINAQIEAEGQLANNPETIDTDPYLYFGHRDSPASDDRQAFFVAALTFYGKAFGDAPVRGTRMEVNWLDIEFREIHKRFISLRNFLAAHAGDKERGIPMVILVPDEENGMTLPLLNVRRNQISYAVDENVTPLEHLIEHAHSKVVGKIAEMTEQLLEHLINVVGWPEIIASAQANKPLNLDLFMAKGARP